ncbi:uncharacterized protein LOC128167072 [Crassostrea angulata]|uniref:uncharacterized protein LOC128167072 n=1 Tax=Magallana angulata TaxID=2784310 RepID=UPI0022B0BBE2|nr:uncharacterized protein LOC128167072 [Crassostrea angulata]
MKVVAAILHLHGFIVIHSSGQLITSSSNFIKQGHVSDTKDLCVFSVHTLEIKSLGECALYCGMNLLCNAFDFCHFEGSLICRLRYGHAKLSNTTTQCELYEITTNKYCPNGFFLRAHGICKDDNLALHSPTTMSSVYADPVYAYQRLGNGSLAVNGEVRPDDTECAVTNEDLYPFLTIDLLDRFHVGRVVFTNRKTSEFRLHDLNVTVGTDGSNFGCFCGFFKGPGTSHQVVNMTCQETCRGRYVRLQIVSGREFLQLCEVEVYSICE